MVIIVIIVNCNSSKVSKESWLAGKYMYIAQDECENNNGLAHEGITARIILTNCCFSMMVTGGRNVHLVVSPGIHSNVLSVDQIIAYMCAFHLFKIS